MQSVYICRREHEGWLQTGQMGRLSKHKVEERCRLQKQHKKVSGSCRFQIAEHIKFGTFICSKHLDRCNNACFRVKQT